VSATAESSCRCCAKTSGRPTHARVAAGLGLTSEGGAARARRAAHAAADSGSSAGSSRRHFVTLSSGRAPASGGARPGVRSARSASNPGPRKSSAGSGGGGGGCSGGGACGGGRVERACLRARCLVEWRPHRVSQACTGGALGMAGRRAPGAPCRALSGGLLKVSDLPANLGWCIASAQRSIVVKSGNYTPMQGRRQRACCAECMQVCTSGVRKGLSCLPPQTQVTKHRTFLSVYTVTGSRGSCERIRTLHLLLPCAAPAAYPAPHSLACAALACRCARTALCPPAFPALAPQAGSFAAGAPHPSTSYAQAPLAGCRARHGSAPGSLCQPGPSSHAPPWLHGAPPCRRLGRSCRAHHRRRDA